MSVGWRWQLSWKPRGVADEAALCRSRQVAIVITEAWGWKTRHVLFLLAAGLLVCHERIKTRPNPALLKSCSVATFYGFLLCPGMNMQKQYSIVSVVSHLH